MTESDSFLLAVPTLNQLQDGAEYCRRRWEGDEFDQAAGAVRVLSHLQPGEPCEVFGVVLAHRMLAQQLATALEGNMDLTDPIYTPMINLHGALGRYIEANGWTRENEYWVPRPNAPEPTTTR